jgi:hypothetical protein
LKAKPDEYNNGTVWNWFANAKVRKLPVSRRVIQEYANNWLKYGEKVHLWHLSGLLGSFTKRHQMCNEVCGAADNVCEETAADPFARYQVPVLNTTCLQQKKFWLLAILSETGFTVQKR